MSCSDLKNFSDPISYAESLLMAFDVLSKRLRLVPDIPLKVSSVQPLNSGIFFPRETYDLVKDILIIKVF